MKVYLNNKTRSIAIKRVVRALERYKPDSVELVKSTKEADLVVMHVNGRLDQNTRKAEKLKADGKKYVVVQYALKSTMRPNEDEWLPLWQGSELVFSYLPLEKGLSGSFPFFYSPLGADSDVFYPIPNEKKVYTAISSGLSYMTESVREVAVACEKVGGKAAHLGVESLSNTNVRCFTGIADGILNIVYNRCHYVSGLRREEGFELPAAEGLLAGCRPVLFDRPHYRKWYGDFAEYIPETDRPGVIDNLTKLFKEYRPVTKEEIEAAKEIFNWEKIMTTFWEKII